MTDVIEQAGQCLNCGADLSGKYCAACGQKKVDRRDLSIRRFFGHVLNELTDLQSNKILRTFVALLFRPGLLTAEYLAGRKGFHIGPVRLYLTFSAIYFCSLGSPVGCAWRRSLRRSRAHGIIQWRSSGARSAGFRRRTQDRAERIAAVLRFLSVSCSGFFGRSCTSRHVATMLSTDLFNSLLRVRSSSRVCLPFYFCGGGVRRKLRGGR